MRSNRAGLGNLQAWLSHGDRHRAAWSLSLFEVTAGVLRPGNTGKNVGLASPAGKSLALLADRAVWGGLDFLASDAFVGQVDHKADSVALKDTASEATPGAAPWRFAGNGRNIRWAKPNEGVVVRGASVGPDWWRDHVFFPAAARLVAHHRPDNPPINSTQVFDPGEGDGDWQAGLHGAVRVRRWLDQFCGGATVVPGEPEPFALLLNFTTSEGDNSGRGAATFADAEALLSVEGKGPLTPADDGNHRVGETDRPIHSGGININEALFGDTPGGVIYSPLAFNPAQWPFPPMGPYPVLTELREDYTDRHVNFCGRAVPGRKKWVTWIPFWEPPPPGEPPEGPPPRDPPSPPGEPPIGPVPSPILPEPPTGLPTVDSGADHMPSPFKGLRPYGYGQPYVTTPSQVDAPSFQLRPMPGLPEAGTFVAPLTGGAVTDHWLSRHGTTARDRETQPIVGDNWAVPVYLSTAPGSSDNLAERWPTQKLCQETVEVADDGRVTGVIPARGPGGEVRAPSTLWDPASICYEGRETWPNLAHQRVDVMLAGKNSAGVTVDGRFGLGQRLRTNATIASGFEFRLNTAPSAATPDMVITGKNASAADSSAGRVHLLNPLALPAEALPGSPLTGQLAIDSGASNGLKWWDGSAWQSAGGGSLSWPLAAPETGTAYSFDNTTSGSNLAGMAYDADTLQGPALVDNTGATQLRVTQAGVEVPNKLTVGGLIDPTGLELAPVAANPGGTAANTLWLDSGDSNALKWGANKLATQSFVSGGYQPLDSELTALASVASAADRLPYFNGAGTATWCTFTGFARTLLADSTAALARATLGLGTLATASTVNDGNWSGTDLAIANGGTGSSTADGALENLIDGATVQTAALDLTTDEISGRDVSAASPDGRAIVLQDVGGLFAPSTNDFRLTGVSGTPVMTADSTSLSTIYLTPYKGNRIALYDTSNSKWKLLSSVEVSLAVTGRTTDLPFDIFAYNNSGTVTLEFLNWASATARSTAIARQDGVWTKSGDASRRYLGTCRPRSATSFHWVMHGSSAGTAARIDLWNMDNRVDIACEVRDATDTWTYTTNTWRQARANAINQIDYVCGIAEDGGLAIAHGISSTNATLSGAVQRWTGIGLDSTTAPATYSLIGSVDSGSESSTNVAHELSSYGHYAIAAAQLSIGRHYLAWLEKSEASGTTTWYGDDGGSGGQAGILFRWRA